MNVRKEKELQEMVDHGLELTNGRMKVCLVAKDQDEEDFFKEKLKRRKHNKLVSTRIGKW